MSKAARFEIWSDAAAAAPAGARIVLLPLEDVSSATRTQDVDGQDRLELSMSRASAAWPDVSDRRVLRTLLEDGTVLEHRILRTAPERSSDGTRLGKVVARSILLDLDNAIVTRSEANGETHATFGLMGFTADALFNIIIAAAPAHFIKGEVDDPGFVLDLFTFDIDSPLSALRRLAELSGLEIGLRGDGVTPYMVDLVTQVGAADTSVETALAEDTFANTGAAVDLEGWTPTVEIAGGVSIGFGGWSYNEDGAAPTLDDLQVEVSPNSVVAPTVAGGPWRARCDNDLDSNAIKLYATLKRDSVDDISFKCGARVLVDGAAGEDAEKDGVDLVFERVNASTCALWVREYSSGTQVGSKRFYSNASQADWALATDVNASVSIEVRGDVLRIGVEIGDTIPDGGPYEITSDTLYNASGDPDNQYTLNTSRPNSKRVGMVFETNTVSGKGRIRNIFVTTVVVPQSVPEFRYAKNLLSVRRTSDAEKLVNRLYAFGANQGGIRADMGDHLFAVAAATVVGSDVDAELADEDVIASDDALNGRGVRRFRSGAASAYYEVVDSTRSSKIVRLTDPLAGPAPDVVAGDLLRFLISPPQPSGAFDGNLLPDGDVDTTGWTTAPLWSKIDEGDTVDTSDFIETSSSSVELEVKDCEVSLTNPGATVDSGSVHRLKVNCRGFRSAGLGIITKNLKLSLYQGTTEIASYEFIPSSSFNWTTYDLSSSEIANITDYPNLRIRLTASMKVIPIGGTTTVKIEVAAAHFKITAPLLEPAGENLIFVEDVASQSSWGQVIDRVEYGEVHLASNLVANASLRDWTGQVPDNWSVIGLGSEFTKEVRANYTRFGGASAMYGVAEADRGLKTDDIPIFPTEQSPYFSAYVVVWNESTDGLRFYVEWDDGADTVQSPVATTTVQDQWVTLIISGLEIPSTATAARLIVLANSTASAPWWLDAAQLTQTGDIYDFIDGRSGNLLWRRAVRELRRRSQPAVAYELTAKDLTAFDPVTWPHDTLVLGGDVKIVDRDLGERGGFDAGFDDFGLAGVLAVVDTLRLVGIRRDLLVGADVALDVETFGEF